MLPFFRINSLIAYAIRPMAMEMMIFFIMGMMVLEVSFGAHIILIHGGKGNIKTYCEYIKEIHVGVL